ncbi:hypothetical protein BDR26DRAFT_824578 [Obelidium mucronatum]|nr:hypothetical protein BDR26DRAFT_824578 [Obelidium mucronatum]
MATHLPPLQPRKSVAGLAAAAEKKNSIAASGGGFNVAAIAQMALEKKREKLKYVSKMNKENLLKDKALYRAERDINLNHFRELMNVFQEHGSKAMTIDDFKSSFGQVLGEGLSEEQMGLLFMKIDANTDNAVDWEEFSTFMLLRAERQSKMQEEASTSLFEVPNPMNPTPKIITPHHESIIGILYLEHNRKYVTVSREGTICFWSDKFRLQRCFLNVGLKTLQLDGREVMKHLGSNKNNPLIDRETPWIHDILYMKPLSKFAIASDDHEITLYNMATMQGKIRFDLKDSVALSMDFWFDEENPDAETCTLFFGTDLGHIYTVNIVNSAFVNKNENAKNKCVTLLMDMFGRGATKGMGTMAKRKAHDNWVGKVKYYHDWHAIVSCSIDPLASLVVAIQDGKNSWSYFSAPVNHGVNTFVYSRFPVALITGGTDHQLRVWNPHRLKNPMASFKGHSSPIIDLVVNELNGQVISLAVDNVIKVWDIRKQMCIQTLFDRVDPSSDDGLNRLYFTSSLKLLAMARNITEYKLKGKDDGGSTAATTTAANKSPHATARTHDFPLRAAIYNPAFKQIVTACDGGVINVWDALSGVHIFKFSETHGKSELTAVAFDVGYRKLITGARDGTIYIWNFHNGQKIKELVNDNAEVTKIIQIEMHSTKYIVAVGWNRKVAIFLDDGDADREFPYSVFPRGKESPPWHSDDIMCVAFAQPNILATASFDGGIVLSNVQSGHMMKRLKWPDQEVPVINKSIEQVIFLEDRLNNPQAADLITAGGDGVIRWWRTCEAELMWEMNGVKGREGESIYTMIVNPGFSTLITGDTLGWVTIYHIKETCIDGRENITVPIVLKQFRAHTRCIVSIDAFESHLVTASTDGTSRLFTNHGKYIGTFGQEQVWDMGEPCNPPIPPDVLLLLGKDEEKSAHSRFRRASARLIKEIKESRSEMQSAAALLLTSLGGGDDDALPVVNASSRGTSRNSTFLADVNETEDDVYVSMSNFSDVVSAVTSAAASAKSSMVNLTALKSAVEKPPAPVSPAARRTSFQAQAARKQSAHSRNHRASIDEGVSWKNRNIKTPDLLQTNYRTWYGKSQYAREFLEKEKLKGKRSPKTAAQDVDDMGKLPNIGALDTKISIAYHSLHPSKISDTSDSLHLVSGLPVVAGIIAKSKAERAIAAAATSAKEDSNSSSIIRNKSVGPNDIFAASKSVTSSDIDQQGLTAGHIAGKPSTKAAQKVLRRLGTPAIRELIDSDSDSKRQAIQDYIFG